MKRAEAKGFDKLSYRTISFERQGPESIDKENRSVEIVVATQEPTEVFDFERYEIVKEILLIDGVEMPNSRQIPLLDTHQRFDTSSVVGSIRELKKEDSQLIGRAFFSSVADVDSIWQKVQEGHLTDFSAGYRPIDSRWIPEGESYQYKGKSFAGPVRITKRWRIKEGSIVPIGADEMAKARSDANTNKNKNHKGETMDPKLREFLVSRGLDPDATEDQAWQFLQSLEVRKDPEPEPEPDKKVEDPQAMIDEIRAEATGEERSRIIEIDSLGKRFDQPDLALKLIREGKSVVEAYRAILKTIPESGLNYHPPATIIADSQDKFRAAATDALLARSAIDYKPEKFAEGHRDLMGFSLRELAREALRVGNLKTAGSPMEMIGRALATSDLPLILANVANKSLFSGWDTAPETWRTWVATDQVADFKIHSLPRASEMADLEEIPESGEYRYGKITEAQEQYQIATYGKLFAITRQTIINDDLGALTRIPAQHGESASRKVADVVYAVLTANAAMGDGTALFHADHGNYQASGAVPGSATIGAGILAMKTQKDLQGLRRLNIRPEFFIAPVTIEGISEVFFQTIQWSDTDTIATDSSLASTRKNLYSGSYFTRVYEPRLDDVDAAAWYLAGPRGKTVVAFFLNGVQTPYLETKAGWSVDGTEYKVRIDVGAKAVDWRGLYLNMGN